MKRLVTASALVAVLAIAGCTGTNDFDKADAFTACQDFVNRQLAYPGSSDFQDVLDADIKIDGKHATVKSYVDAANGFGAQSRRAFTCEVTKTDDHWRLDNLDINLE